MTDQQTSRTNITEALREILFQWDDWYVNGARQDDARFYRVHDAVIAASEALAAEPSEPTGFDLRSNDVRPPRSDAVTADTDEYPNRKRRRLTEPRNDAVTAPDEDHNAVIAAGYAMFERDAATAQPNPSDSASPDEPSRGWKPGPFDDKFCPHGHRMVWKRGSVYRCESGALWQSEGTYLVGVPNAAARSLADAIEREARAAHLNPADSGSSASVPLCSSCGTKIGEGARCHDCYWRMVERGDSATASGSTDSQSPGVPPLDAERLTRFLVTITDDTDGDWRYPGSRRDLAREIAAYAAETPEPKP